MLTGKHAIRCVRLPSPPPVVIFALLAAFANGTGLARAENRQDHAAAGLQVAREFCNRCHVVAPGEGRGWTDAPSFESIANDPNTSAQFLRNFLQQPHMHMLAYNEARAHTEDLVAYILSLRR